MIRFLKTLAIILIGLVGWIFWCGVIIMSLVTNDTIVHVNLNAFGEYIPELFFTIILSEILIMLLLDYINHAKRYVKDDVAKEK